MILAAAAVFTVLLIIWIVLLCIRAFDRSKIKEIEKHSKKGTRYLDYENYEKALEEYEKALELTEGLSLRNWQYISRKEELMETVSGQEALMVLVQEAQAAFSSGEYEKAEKLYTQIQKEAAWQGFALLSADAEKKTAEIFARRKIFESVYKIGRAHV